MKLKFKKATRKFKKFMKKNPLYTDPVNAYEQGVDEGIAIVLMEMIKSIIDSKLCEEMPLLEYLGLQKKEQKTEDNSKRMKISTVTDQAIFFDNGNTITYNHEQDCCECNYADFSVLNENTINYDYAFNENLEFKKIDKSGFMFGSEGRWIFIPCYSSQNGYYSDDIDIYYNYKKVESLTCALDLD